MSIAYLSIKNEPKLCQPLVLAFLGKFISTDAPSQLTWLEAETVRFARRRLRPITPLEIAWMEEVGETLGWGSIFVASAAGILLPARRMVKPVKAHFPAGQKSLVSVVKGLTKYHIWIGVTAMGVSLLHGISLYFAEDQLDIGDWVGAVSATLMIVAGVIGGMLAVNKKNMKRWKKPHVYLLLLAGFFAIIHILAS
ncbi:hypothetical protein J2Z37_000002 [Ammoniphilus resinae]|uniref:Uncharacterized protein n=1 Tax=Ammoniphilus resinae TaxID=861532 RepID=A0ABS4GID1_9BACL|nr:hypothetical protein [Ammoniphilus resinae]